MGRIKPGTWRASAHAYIMEVINENPDADEKTLRKLISQAYPYGERAMHPYKIWCSEVNILLKQRFIKNKPGEQETIDFGLFSNQTTATNEN